MFSFDDLLISRELLDIIIMKALDSVDPKKLTGLLELIYRGDPIGPDKCPPIKPLTPYFGHANDPIRPK